MNIYLTLVKDLVISILYFPIWWYGRGLFKFAKILINSLQTINDQVGFSIWLKNIFVPLFGEHDFSGRLISFILRLVNIILRGIVVLIYCIILLSIFMVWVLIPIIILYKIIS